MLPIATVVIAIVAFLVIYFVGNQNEFDSSVAGEAPANSGISALARAIAYAEGFGTVGAIPTVANNPGDLKIPNWTGESTSNGISIFSSISEGWSRLYHQLNIIESGDSQIYNDGMMISEMAQKWTATNPQDWANNVSSSLTSQGYPATPNSLLYEIIGG